MAEDISITIKADPTQAVNGINTVKKAASDLGATAKQANAEMQQSAAAGNQVAQSVGKTVSAVGNLSGEVKTLSSEASKVSAALGESVPVIGQIGSALSAAMSGPIAAITAAVTFVVIQIKKGLDHMKELQQLSALQGGAQTSSAYDTLMKGRKDYAEQLDVLAKIKELNAAAKTTPLVDTAELRKLAARIGIDAKAVGANGIDSRALWKAEENLRKTREHDAAQDYTNYVEAAKKQLAAAIRASDLDDFAKERLLDLSFAKQKKAIEDAAANGTGVSTKEFEAYQKLGAMVRPMNEVRDSYKRDRMLGRSQAELDAETFGSVKDQIKMLQESEAGQERFRKKLAENTAKKVEAEKRAAAAADTDAKRRQDAGDAIFRKLREQLDYQQLVSDGKKKEAELLRDRLSVEAAYGRQLTDAEAAELAELSGRLFDLRNPAGPSPEPEAEAAVAAATVRARQFAAPLDRLQRIGANGPASVTSPEKMVMDKQLSVQEDIRRLLYQTATQTYKETVMRF